MIRPRGYFGVDDKVLLDGRRPADVNADPVPNVAEATIRVPFRPQRAVRAVFEDERITARTWPAGRGRRGGVPLLIRRRTTDPGLGRGAAGAMLAACCPVPLRPLMVLTASSTTLAAGSPLADLQWQARLVVVTAADPSDPQLLAQRERRQGDLAGWRERAIRLVEVTGEGGAGRRTAFGPERGPAADGVRPSGRPLHGGPGRPRWRGQGEAPRRLFQSRPVRCHRRDADAAPGAGPAPRAMSSAWAGLRPGLLSRS